MTTRTAAPVGAPNWIDLASSDVAASRDFYESLFGWTSDEPDPDLGGYLNFWHAGERVAGCMPARPEACADVWTAYLASADAEAACQRVLAAGGTVHAPAMDVADLGRMAVVADPGGAAVGIWQPGSHPGLLTLAEPGHAAWFELHTGDHAASVAFYRDVFGWDIEMLADSDEFRYAIASVQGEQVAGVHDISREDRRSQWTMAFAVQDADTALRRADELGGAVVEAPFDSPYGRLALATDRTGAPFTLAS